MIVFKLVAISVALLLMFSIIANWVEAYRERGFAFIDMLLVLAIFASVVMLVFAVKI